MRVVKWLIHPWMSSPFHSPHGDHGHKLGRTAFYCTHNQAQLTVVFKAEGESWPPLLPPSTPLIMECALVSTRQHCNWATSQSLRTTVVIMVFFAAFILQPLYRAAEFRQKIIIKESLPLSFLDYESRYYSLYCNCVPQDLLFQSSRHRKTAAWSLSIFYKIATHENETGVRQSRFFLPYFPPQKICILISLFFSPNLRSAAWLMMVDGYWHHFGT